MEHFKLIGLTRPRGGALSTIRNQRLLIEATSSVKIRVFSLALWGCIPTAEKVDLKFIQCGFESHHPYQPILVVSSFHDKAERRLTVGQTTICGSGVRSLTWLIDQEALVDSNLPLNIEE